MLKFKIIFMALLFILVINSCLTTNYYTARTLDKGETVLTPGLDNLLIDSSEEAQRVIAFSPGLGIVYGPGYRLETGVRLSFPFLLEGNVRYQINPKTFSWFDLSANLHSGFIINNNLHTKNAPFWKYGFTISKQIRTIEPYFSFYLIKHYQPYDKDILDEEYFNFKNFTFGTALPIFKYDQLFPEINYLINENTGEIIYTFSIGLRAHLNRGSLKKKH